MSFVGLDCTRHGRVVYTTHSRPMYTTRDRAMYTSSNWRDGRDVAPFLQTNIWRGKWSAYT